MDAVVADSHPAARGSVACRAPDLVCPAGSLPALKAAVDHGATCVYTGFRDATNARNFAGLNFSLADLEIGVRYARDRGVRVLIALNTYPQAQNYAAWCAAVDRAAAVGAHAIIVADAGLMAYAAKRHPNLALHLSVQGSATTYEAINFYADRFGIKRAVLPRVLTLGQVASVVAHARTEIEVFAFGSLCVMVEGRCQLSSYVTGQGPNLNGVCSPASAVRWTETAAGREVRLAGVLVDRFAPGENAGYPTLCKGRYEVEGATGYAIEEPVSLNTLSLLPKLCAMGVRAVKIEGRQRSVAYVAEVTAVWRAAIDACICDPEHFEVDAAWDARLARLAEGRQVTLGVYHRSWR
ncbi:MAG: U32 family peptidase [Burkholderiales bacterium]|nr:U32 family peptidase [Burkholderiales bacterium]